MFSSRGFLFVALNAVRAMSLLALILVFASNILVMVHDIQAVNRSMANPAPIDTSDNSTDISMFDCDYIEGSTVPQQPAGVFTAVVNRLLILFECIVLILAEIGFPLKFFDAYFPVLGSKFGVGALGVFQCLIGASVLSHHIGTFALVSAFLLFSIGCVNMLLLGLIFRAGVKTRRALNPAQSDLPSSIKGIKPMFSSPFPEGFANVTHSHYSASTTSSEKTAAPAYGFQAANAFGRANEKSTPILARAISVTKPEEAHPHFAPRVTFGSRASEGSPSFESSPGNAV